MVGIMYCHDHVLCVICSFNIKLSVRSNWLTCNIAIVFST